jgi:hypothetical protein
LFIFKVTEPSSIHSVGFSPVLDNPRAARYNPTQAGAAGHSGNGFCNNRPFTSASEYQIAAQEATTINNIANTALQHKLSRYVDTSMSVINNGIYGAATKYSNDCYKFSR